MAWRASRPIRERVICPTYKVRYPSQTKAQESLDVLLDYLATSGERRRGFETPRRVYLCQSCGGWHMTSQPL